MMKYLVFERDKRTKVKYVLKVFNERPAQAVIDALPTHASAHDKAHLSRYVKEEEYFPIS